jgi:hypothetical protein
VTWDESSVATPSEPAASGRHVTLSAGAADSERARRETPDTVHGRLLEAVHIAGYTWKRACDELDWILDDNRWQAVGGGDKTIKTLLRGCVEIRKSEPHEERKGIDYVALLRGGASVNIDEKTRSPGSRRHWKGEPDLALEYLSDVDRKVAGWTLSESNETDLVLYTFDPADTDICYLVAFQPLRMAFARNLDEWISEYGFNGKAWRQTSNGGKWKSEALFVPASVVLEAIREQSRAVVELQESVA